MRRAARSAIALTITAAVIGGGIWGTHEYIQRSQVFVSVECDATISGLQHSLAPDQAANAATVAAVAVGRGLPARATSIALATAYQESKLRNLSHGDTAGPDSRGLFQQRPSQGWGTQAQIMDPVYAAGAFYSELVKFDYQHMSITQAAQKVQRSAFPDAYADHEGMGRAYASALTGQSPAALTCSLRRSTAAGKPSAVLTDLKREYGGRFSGAAGDSTVTVPVDSTAHGWAVAQWAVAHAQGHQSVRVSYAGQSWTRSRGTWEADPSASSAGRAVTIEVATAAEQD